MSYRLQVPGYKCWSNGTCIPCNLQPEPCNCIVYCWIIVPQKGAKKAEQLSA